MAGVSTKEIKNRIRSMESTKQITKAMEMVAASKLRKAQAQVLNSRPYFEVLYQTIHDISDANRDFSSPYFEDRKDGKWLYVVIAGDRGLAGGYNSNVFKLVMAEMEGKDAMVLPVGKKALDYFKTHNVPLAELVYAEAEDVSVSDCFTMAKTLCKGFVSGKFDRISVVYTNFVSVLSQTPASLTLLPLTRGSTENTGVRQDMLYEPDSVDVFDAIVPEYLGGTVLCARAALPSRQPAGPLWTRQPKMPMR